MTKALAGLPGSANIGLHGSDPWDCWLDDGDTIGDVSPTVGETVSVPFGDSLLFIDGTGMVANVVGLPENNSEDYRQ